MYNRSRVVKIRHSILSLVSHCTGKILTHILYDMIFGTIVIVTCVNFSY